MPAEFEAIAAQRNRALTSASAHLIPDDLIEAFTWAGTSEDVARQVAAVVDMGFENIAFLPHLPGQTVELTVEAFARKSSRGSRPCCEADAWVRGPRILAGGWLPSAHSYLGGP